MLKSYNFFCLLFLGTDLSVLKFIQISKTINNPRTININIYQSGFLETVKNIAMMILIYILTQETSNFFKIISISAKVHRVYT